MRDVYVSSGNMDISSKYSHASRKPQPTGLRFSNSKPSEENIRESIESMDLGVDNVQSKGTKFLYFLLVIF